MLSNGAGSSGTSSQDFVRLAGLLFAESAAYAKRCDGNVSIYVLAGIPVLLSALRCLLIELNSGSLSSLRQFPAVLTDLVASTSEVGIICKHYPVSKMLTTRLELLREVRHEILHPAHRSGPEANNTPAYLAPLRRGRLLQSTGSQSDYIWLGQLQSHKLFRWAFETTRRTVSVLLTAHGVDGLAKDGLRASYARYGRLSRG